MGERIVGNVGMVDAKLCQLGRLLEERAPGGNGIRGLSQLKGRNRGGKSSQDMATGAGARRTLQRKSSVDTAQGQDILQSKEAANFTPQLYRYTIPVPGHPIICRPKNIH